jgi:hypothetical protein
MRCFLRLPGSSRPPTVAPCVSVFPTPGWPRTFRPAWWGTRGLSRTNSGGSRPDRIPRPAAQPETGPRGRSAAAGPGGGTTLGWGASVAPPPVFPPEPAATTASGEHRERALDAGRCARLPALIATLSGPDREIVSLRVVAGVSIPAIVAGPGCHPPRAAWPSIRPWAHCNQRRVPTPGVVAEEVAAAIRAPMPRP